MQNFAWNCEMRGLIYAKRTGAPSYAGTYMAIYFDDFKVLAIRNGGTWKLINKAYPLNYPGGVYGMASDCERRLYGIDRKL